MVRLLAILVAALPATVLAQSPIEVASPRASTTRLLPVAGTLTDEAGAPLTGTVTVTFALYDAAENGTTLWSETQPVQADAHGQYTAYLGSVTPVPQTAFSQERARWLGVEVGSRQLPRVLLVAVPYALRAADAETLEGRRLSEFVLADRDGRRPPRNQAAIDDPVVDGTGVPNQLAKWSSTTTLSSSILTESLDNRLGVLAPDPTGGGVVDSRVTIRNPDNNTALAVLNPLNQRRFALNTLTGGGWTLYDGVSGVWNAGLSQRSGRVAIGPFHSFENFRLNVFSISPTSHGLFTFSEDASALIAQTVTGWAGRFIGDVDINGSLQVEDNLSVGGMLSKGGGSFTIDHPLDPANKYLQHSFVESPDMLNVYNGNATLDGNGEAWVALPAWFEALNRDFRYQLTAIGAPAPNLHVASRVVGNRFRIAGGTPGGEVSWQVTGIRQDAWANAHRIEVEKDKPASVRGSYLHPELFRGAREMR